ncbi:lipopolysaccharide biosynthesis protein [Roseateles sp. P5_E11]
MIFVSGTPPTMQARGSFIRAVVLLSSAGMLAHGITALAMPILARLYLPADFGLLSVLSSSLGILSVAACLRYELAIALPQDAKDADRLLTLSLAVCTVVSLGVALMIAMAPDAVMALLRQPGLRPYLWMIPVGVWLAGAYSALQAWHVRHASFGRLARTRVAQSAGSAGLQMMVGWHGAGPVGLLLGQVANTGIACLALMPTAWAAMRELRWSSLRHVAFEYRRFPIYSTAEALANSAAVYLPVILVAAYAGPAEAGYLGMAMYVAQAPMSLIGNSISQVFLSRAALEHREGRLPQFVVQVVDGLIKAGVGPLLALGIIAPQICEWLFGAGWARTGWLVSCMTPWFLLQFLVVPISTTLHICGRQRAALFLQLAGLLIRLGGVWLLDWARLGHISEGYAATGALFYGLYLGVVLAVAGVSAAQVWNAIRANGRVLVLWTGAAVFASVLTRVAVNWATG